MSTWHRTDDQGIPVQFTATADERGNVTLTVQEFEGLMCTGGWKPGPITDDSPPFSARLAAMSIESMQRRGR